MATETVSTGDEAPARLLPPRLLPPRLLGVCAAIGDDFGFNPLWLRVGFAVALLFNLEIVLATYAGLGVLVLASRLIFPNRKVAPTADAVSETPADMPVMYRQAA